MNNNTASAERLNKLLMMKWMGMLAAGLILSSFLFSATALMESETFVSAGQTNSADLQSDAATAVTNGKIAFGSDRGGVSRIYAMNADGSNQTRLTDFFSIEPAFSADGSKIAFRGSRPGEGTSEIYVMNADGSNPTRLTTDQAEVRNPAFSPDGSKIVFYKFSGGNAEIFVMNADGTNQINLTNNPAFEDFPVFSPDGSKIAFESTRDNSQEVYIMNADGSNQINLSRNTAYDGAPAFSPDGGKIAFHSGRDGSGEGEIYVMNYDGSNQTRLTINTAGDGSPAFSPDGSKITFGSGRDGNGEIYVMNSDGSNQTRLTTDPAGDGSPSWQPLLPASAPGNGKIAFETNRDGNFEIYVMNPDGTNQVNLTNNAAGDFTPSFSSDGRKIVFGSFRDNANGEIYVMNSDGSNQIRLTNNTEVEYSPAFSPNGSRIVFASRPDINSNNSDIYVMNSDGSNKTRLTNNGGNVPSFSPDGSKIVFTSGRDGDGSRIYIMNSDGTNQTKLTGASIYDDSPAFSPDGSKIVFFSGRNGNAEIYVMNPDGTNQTRLTNNTAGDGQPAFSPDSSKIAFLSSRDGNDEIYTMNADGTNQTRLTNNPAIDGQPSWQRLSTNGTSGNGKITFHSFRDGNNEIYTMNPDGTNPVNLTNNAAFDALPSFSFDGRKIVFNSERDGNREIYVMNADGTNQTRLTNNSDWDQSPAFSPDGSKIVFDKVNGNVGIYVMNSDGSNQTRLTDISSDGSPTFSPDGSKIAFNRTNDNSGIYVMNSDGTSQIRLTNGGGDGQPDFSPDGSKIVFSKSSAGIGEIYVMNADGSNQIRLTNNSTDDLSPDFSPDGSKIVFRSDRDGNGEVYVMNLDGTNQTRLTNNSAGDGGPSWQALPPRIAATNGKIAFAAYPGFTDIYLMNADGTNPTRLTREYEEETQPDFSLDGSKIAFVVGRDQRPFSEFDTEAAPNGREGIYVMNSDGTNQVRLIEGFSLNSPDFSPDGSKIVYTRGDYINGEIYIMNADGSNQTRLTSSNGVNGTPTFSPNGSKIVFACGGDGGYQICVMNTDGSNQTRLTNIGYNIEPTFSPDGSRILFTGGRPGMTSLGIYLMNADGTGETLLTNNGFTPAWSPDGTKIVFVSRRDGSQEIYTMNANGTNQQRLTNPPNDENYPDWQPIVATHLITGKITSSGNPLPNVTVSLSFNNGIGTFTLLKSTDAAGNYSFTNLTAGTTYTVMPSLANYTFSPSSKTFPFISANQTADFTAAVTSSRLKVCKIAGLGVAPGTPFQFDVTGTSAATGLQVTRRVEVIAGAEQHGGFCNFVPGAASEPETFVIGTKVLIDEIVPAGTLVSRIRFNQGSATFTASTSANPATVRLPSGTSESVFPNPDLSGGRAVITVLNGTNEVEFTNTTNAPITVTIPNTLTSRKNTTLTVPVNVTDVSGRGIISYDFRITYDPAVLTPLSPALSKAGTLSSGFEVAVNSSTPGTLIISGFGSTALTGSGTLLNLKFNTVGNAPTCGALNFAAFRFNAGDPAAVTINGRSCVVGGDISGKVVYGTSTTTVNIPRVTVSATGTPNVGFLTGSEGTYTLSGLGGGAYTVTPSKTGEVNNAVGPFDASLIAQSAVETITLNANQRIAADVNSDGMITSFDAALTAQYSVAIANLGIAGTWKFTPPNRSYPNIETNQTNQDYTAILIGDVSGNWRPLNEPFAENAPEFVLADAVSVSLPNMNAAPNQTVTIPITVGDVTGRGVLAYQFDLTYDAAVLQPQTEATEAAGTLSNGLNVVTNATAPGRLRVAVFGTQALTGAGTLLKLRFNVVGQIGANTSLVWQQFQFNEGEPTVNRSNGQISVRRRTAVTLYDFDGDGKSDISVFRPESGMWHLEQSQSGYAGIGFGLSTDKLVPADFDGDRKTDIAVFRENPLDPGKAKFYILNSSNNQLKEEQFGSTGDVPAAGDWDGDGKADVGVYRSGTQTNPQGYFYYRPSSQPSVNFISYPWGSPGDKPVIADYDGDGKVDPAVFRPSTGEWFIQRSRDGFYAIQFGAAEDKPVVGDYDADGKADQAVFRPSNGVWYVWNSTAGFSAAQFGISTDKPAPADYDGDGQTDMAVYRDGNWFLLNSANGFAALGFGNSTDKPVPNAFVP